MFGFLDDIGSWFSGAADSVGDYFSGTPEAGQIYDSPIGPEMGGLATDPNHYADAIGPGVDGEALGGWTGGSTEQYGWDTPTSAQGAAGGAASGLAGAAGKAASGSGLWDKAGQVIGKTAKGLLGNGGLGGGSGSSAVTNNILNAASKIAPTATPSTPAPLGQSRGPAATVNASDAVAAWTKLFGAHA